MIRYSYLGADAFRWTVGESIFEAVPEIGARLMRWQLSGRSILDWPDDLASPDQIPFAHGGNPILFPFPARCFDQGEPLCWRADDGERRPMPMHGIARQGFFALTHVDESGFTATFQPEATAREAYPFDYSFTVTYRFFSSGLICELTLENQGSRPIPWSAGHHFYFALPLADGMDRTDHYVELYSAQGCHVSPDTKGLIVPNAPFAGETAIDHPNFLNAAIHYGLLSNAAILSARADIPTPRIVVRHGDKPQPVADFAFVTWSPPHAPFYCVEPWMGPSNSPEHRVGLHWVLPGERRSHQVSVDVVPPTVRSDSPESA